ncbi:helix-turn-helix domain-containing protein [Roseixanthobacter glucoisosaccharinicivorans]|uniref:helix-turn-helix domain-containing protein n=1 Tax=Roseixanthobacter glucoisosaccharinicivorans TaxID=3119923 RepID=UPI0037278D9B
MFPHKNGSTFTTWRRQACLAVSLPRLVAGELITETALALGYNNPGTFPAMFLRALGMSPRACFKQNDAAAGDFL